MCIYIYIYICKFTDLRECQSSVEKVVQGEVFFTRGSYRLKGVPEFCGKGSVRRGF